MGEKGAQSRPSKPGAATAVRLGWKASILPSLTCQQQQSSTAGKGEPKTSSPRAENQEELTQSCPGRNNSKTASPWQAREMLCNALLESALQLFWHYLLSSITATAQSRQWEGQVEIRFQKRRCTFKILQPQEDRIELFVQEEACLANIEFAFNWHWWTIKLQTPFTSAWMCRKQPATEHYIGNTVLWHPAAFCHVNHSPFNNDSDAELLRGGKGSSDHYTPANIIRVNYPISTKTDLIREQGASMLFKCRFQLEIKNGHRKISGCLQPALSTRQHWVPN